MFVLGIGGCTCAGKTTVTRLLAELLTQSNCCVKVINQDQFYKPTERIEPLPQFSHYRYDDPQAVNWPALIDAVHTDKHENNNDDGVMLREVCILDGNMIFLEPTVDAFLHARYFLTLPFEECRRRRKQRTDYEPPDVPGYFDDYVWPAYESHLRSARVHNPKITFFDGCESAERIVRVIYMDLLRQWHDNDWVQLQRTPLDLQLAHQFVVAPQNGAVSIFVGTTRDNFEAKTVVRLEYEAYESMAMQEMRAMCDLLRTKWPDVHRIALIHRLGVVPVCEASVVIAVSSPHRVCAQQATQWAIDQLKRTVPVWKKEIYEDDSHSWKQNPESKWINADHRS